MVTPSGDQQRQGGDTPRATDEESGVRDAAEGEKRQAEIDEWTSKRLAERRAAGRYTLREAAAHVADATGENQGPILDRLRAAAWKCELPTYRSRSNLRINVGRAYTGIGRGGEETYWNDLNAWLEKYEPHIPSRFPAPKSQDNKLADVQQASDEPLTARDDEKPLRTRERRNLWRIIRVLMAIAGDRLPEGKETAIIEAKMTGLGFNRPKTEAIRQAVKAAKGEEPDSP